ncbi:putative 4-hydroxybenzoyl-CoA reductase, beta subunit [delta proteobacterium NaphS2]|nr:putative 4-hydroxybenzoyl-CoA reductase, beta subunit [delta proteobacterium NaphS2]
MISSEFKYICPKSIEEALERFGEFQGEAVYLSGGTDLVPRMKLGLKKPRAVIDLKDVASMSTVAEEGDYIRIGSLAQLFQLKQTDLVSNRFPALAASLEATSCETLQVRGTIGGNLLQNTRCLFYNQSEFWRRSKGFCLKMGGEKCNAVPGAKKCFANYTSDNAPALCTLQAEVAFAGPNGSRRFKLESLYTGRSDDPFDLEPGEILTDIFVPNKTVAGGYEKLRVRGAVDYPLLGVAFSRGSDSGRLAVGAVGPRPYTVELNEPAQDAMGEAVATVINQVKTVENTVLESAYRKRMIPVLAERLIKKVMEGAE